MRNTLHSNVVSTLPLPETHARLKITLQQGQNAEECAVPGSN